jgi:hypothetical protein
MQQQHHHHLGGPATRCQAAAAQQQVVSQLPLTSAAILLPAAAQAAPGHAQMSLPPQCSKWRLSCEVRLQEAAVPAELVQQLHGVRMTSGSSSSSSTGGSTSLPLPLLAKLYLNDRKLANRLHLLLCGRPLARQQQGQQGQQVSARGAVPAGHGSPDQQQGGDGWPYHVSGLTCVPADGGGVCVVRYRLTSQGLLEVLLQAPEAAAARVWQHMGRLGGQ